MCAILGVILQVTWQYTKSILTNNKKVLDHKGCFKLQQSS